MESTDMANIEKIDLNEFLDKLMHGMKRLWWLILLLTVFGTTASYFRISSAYVPHYEAEATLTITTAKSDDVTRMVTRLVPSTACTEICPGM